MVAFWQLLLSFHILVCRLCLPFSHTLAFCQLFHTRILATFSLLCSHAPQAPVLARDPIFAAFARTVFDGRILAASNHTLLSQ